MKKLIYLIPAVCVVLSAFFIHQLIKKRNQDRAETHDLIKETLNEDPMYEERIEKLEKEKKALQEFYDSAEPKLNKLNDSIYILNKRLQALEEENLKKPTQQFKRNENTLPIARSSSAIELREFFTNRYSND